MSFAVVDHSQVRCETGARCRQPQHVIHQIDVRARDVSIGVRKMRLRIVAQHRGAGGGRQACRNTAPAMGCRSTSSGDKGRGRPQSRRAPFDRMSAMSLAVRLHARRVAALRPEREMALIGFMLIILVAPR